MTEELEFSWNAGGQEPMDFSPMKPGKYKVCIVEVKPSHSRNGDMMMETHCVVDQEEGRGRHIWNRITFISEGKPGAGIAVHFLKTIGEPFDIHNDFKVNAKNWLGRRFMATIQNETYTNPSTMEQRVNNVIKGIEPVPAAELENKALVAKYASKKSATSDDEVPF
jgi:hypothetical protein